MRSLDAFPGNLPVQLTSFVGRESELKLVADAVGDARLVTITGAGGVGKTRLAMQAAAELVSAYPDGAWLCELAAAEDAESMMQVIAALLGVQPRPGVSLAASVREFLAPKQVLVVLDNCEHLVSAAGRFVEALLRECGGVRVLATSREGLGVPGEHVWPLRSLGVPEDPTVSGIAASEAGQLFVERTRGTGSAFALDESNAASVAEICERLDGIPLAIELAAARAASLSPTEIASLLDERFRLLTGGRRIAVERHKTLRAAVDWSYSMLDDIDRRVFDRLGVFAGTFDIVSARAVVEGAGIESWDVLDAVASLVAKSMLVVEASDTGSTRYQMLETLRAYARERLDAAGDADGWRRRHAEHYAVLAEQLGQGLVGPDELVWRRRFRAELDNLRAAVTWALDSKDDAELAVRIVAELAWYASWDRTSGIGTWAERAVPAAERSREGLRAAVLVVAGMSAWVRGDIERARSLYVAGMRDGIPLDSPAPGSAHGMLAIVEALKGRPDLGLEHLAVARALLELRDADDRTFALAVLESQQATLATMMGDVSGARAAGQESLRFMRALGYPSGQTLALFLVAWATRLDDPDGALALADESLALTRAGASDVLFGSTLALAAQIRAQRGDRIWPIAALHEALGDTRESGDRPELIGVLDRAVVALSALGSPEHAAVAGGAVTGGPLAHLSFLPDMERRERADALERARAELGDDAYHAAITRGAAMTYEQNLEYWINELGRLIDEAPDA